MGALRIGEASGLQRSDVNLDAGTIRIENNAVQVLGRPIRARPRPKPVVGR
jgi:integrase